MIVTKFGGMIGGQELYNVASLGLDSLLLTLLLGTLTASDKSLLTLLLGSDISPADVRDEGFLTFSNLQELLAIERGRLSVELDLSEFVASFFEITDLKK